PVGGTPGYLAPEQARGGPVDARTDLFLLGLLLYELCTGQRAYSGDDAEALRRQAAERRMPPLHELPVRDARLTRVIHGLLKADPATRIQTATKVREILDGTVIDDGPRGVIHSPKSGKTGLRNPFPANGE